MVRASDLDTNVCGWGSFSVVPNMKQGYGILTIRFYVQITWCWWHIIYWNNKVDAVPTTIIHKPKWLNPIWHADRSFVRKGGDLNEGPSFFNGPFYTAKRTLHAITVPHHTIKGHYCLTSAPFQPPKEPKLGHRTALSTAKEALEGLFLDRILSSFGPFRPRAPSHMGRARAVCPLCAGAPPRRWKWGGGRGPAGSEVRIFFRG